MTDRTMIEIQDSIGATLKALDRSAWWEHRPDLQFRAAYERLDAALREAVERFRKDTK